MAEKMNLSVAQVDTHDEGNVVDRGDTEILFLEHGDEVINANARIKRWDPGLVRNAS